MKTDFQNSLTIGFLEKLYELLQGLPLHLNYDATLPCEIQNLK